MGQSKTPAKDAAAAAGQQAGSGPPSAPAGKKTSYRIFLTAGQAADVTVHAQEQDEAKEKVAAGGPEVWPFGPTGELSPFDLLYLGAQSGHTREAAVGALLDEGGGSGSTDARLAPVRAYCDAGESLTFSVVAAGSLGSVPVETEVKRSRKIGG